MRLTRARSPSSLSTRSLLPLAVVALALALGPVPPPAVRAAWINDRSGEPPRLSLEQSLWAMGRLPRGGKEWSLEEKVEKLAAAGFDGFMVFLPPTGEEQDRYRALAQKHGLAITLQCAPSTLSDLEVALAAAKRLGARALVAMVRPAFVSYEEGAEKIEAMQRACAGSGVPFYLETHRGTITQDLFLTRGWAEAIPGIQFHADLSHFVVSYEIAGPPAAPIREAVTSILRRTGMIDGRVGNGEQVQIDIGPQGENPHARLFAGWWKEAMVHWLREAIPGEVFVFKSELGPPSYSIVGPGGEELSDRWAQALVMRDLAVRTWNEAVEEAGRGQPYRTGEGGRKREAAPGAATGLTAETCLDVEPSGIFCRHGQCFKIGEYYLSGQLGPATYAVAREKGIRTVINVRLTRELAGLGFDTEFIVKDEGMEYRHLPVGPDNIAQEAEVFLETLKAVPKPVLIQGSNGNRVWGLWALFVGSEFGVPLEATRKVAAEHAIEKLVIDGFVREYLARKKG